MAGTFPLSRGLSADFPVPGVKLTHFQARLWDWLQARRHLERGICQATRTIAGLFGVSVRTVQLAMKFFLDMGVLDRHFDYGLRTRRRYFLATPPTNSFGATDCAESAQPVAPTSVPPLEPPIEVSGEREEGTGDGGCAAAAGPPPPPGIHEAPPTEETQPPLKATPEQVAELVEQAAKVFPSQPKQWVLALARTWTLSWVRAAIGRAGAKRAEGAEVRTGYVVRTLQGFAAEGGPPAELTAPERGQDEVMRLFMEAFERA